MMMESIPSGTILHGRYRVERMLGTGGFGHVYLAVDLNTNQQYALKEFFVSGSGGQAHLQHEANVLSELHHPNLPAFHEAFSENGHYFVVLSYIDGRDLTELVRIARVNNEIIPTARILTWILSICDAVSFLHNHQPPLIHRDIKPDNIRIMANGTAVLVDLGNAKAAANGERTLFFIRHQGTPGYAPQEQYPGGSGTDTRSDIYALGGTLYFALTAHEPPNISVRTQAIQQRQPDLPSLQEQIAQNPPPEADAQPNRQYRGGSQQRQGKHWPRHSRHLAQLGTLSPALLDQLNRIIARAMAMRQRDRYQSVTDFGADLKKVLNALPATTIPASPPPRALDPNSTQPDLPQLFETIEEAKMQSASSVPPAHPQPAPTIACPRCGTIVIASAAYCSNCGSVLRAQPQQQAPANHEDAASRAAGPPPAQASAIPRDVSFENTIVMRPQGRAATQVKAVAAPTPPSRITHIPASQSQAYRHAAHNDHSATRRHDASQSTGASPRSSWLVMVILVAVVILALIVLMILLLMHHSHVSSDIFNPTIGLGGVAYDTRNFSGIIASSAASLVAWVWACCPGISSAAGIS